MWRSKRRSTWPATFPPGSATRFCLKREDMQPVFSFKLRGAYNKIASLSAEKLKRGVICASAGNHAQGVALSAAKVGCRAVIVMPTSTPGIKIDAVKRRGGEVVLFGASYDDAYAHALELEKSEKLTFVHPFDDPEVIAGQGTIGHGNPAPAFAPQRADPRHFLRHRRRRPGAGWRPTSSACGRKSRSSASKPSMPMR
jgi:hypothetical protein